MGPYSNREMTVKRFFKYLVLCVVAGSQSAFSANVLWNQFNSSNWSGDSYKWNGSDYVPAGSAGGIGIWYYETQGVMPASPELAFIFYPMVYGARIELYPDGINLASRTRWLLGEAGDRVSEEMFQGTGPYLFDPAGNGNAFEMEMSILDTVFIAFEAGESPGELVYGWIAMSYNGDSLVLTGSAWDADGGPMIVGGGSALIPEPSAAVLLLVGGALLALRRRALV